MIKLLRAKIRALVDGHVQRATVRVFDDMERTAIERLQDYGFAAAPADGNGLVVTLGGHMFILRMDRPAGRPDLAADEVAVWHKDGHKIVLRAGQVIDVECQTYNIKAAQVNVTAEEINIDAAKVNAPGAKVTMLDLDSEKGTIAGIDFESHGHTGVQTGPNTSGPAVNR